MFYQDHSLKSFSLFSVVLNMQPWSSIVLSLLFFASTTTSFLFDLYTPHLISPPCFNCHCDGGPAFVSGYSKADLLALDDNTLFNIGLGGINECRIVESPVGNGDFCDLYVKSGSDGYPLNQECQGIGCVKAPDFPRAINTCWYARDEFCPEIQGLSGDFCTDSGVANAAAQLRHAIKNDHCNCANLADTRPALVPIVSSDITPSPILTGFPFFPRRPLPWLP
eukprot:TRINITY_DN3116_c0_g1_i17.p2 TRINITY_DN3116_c0_g1~~TRINITY_DN3116_c0_g1_i17.p2  ORF type:complete len:223 (+),score=0.98 TRINITY_DN3116_c0_g1_i17:249-917(+)